MFYVPTNFQFTRFLEQNWRKVYQEYLNIKDQIVLWPEFELYDRAWQVFGLFSFPDSKAIAPHIEQCPFTASLIQTHIPQHGAVGFSVLQPMTRIKPHQGYQGNFLRCHLGLQIPSGNCALKLKNEFRQWRTGEVLIFDDRDWHEAWNLTDEERVILLLDFIPELL